VLGPRGGGNRWRRWLSRGAVLAAALVLLLPGWPCDWAPLAVPSLSPYVAVAAAIAARLATRATLLALPLACLAILWPRCFCRWLCPTGLLMEVAGRLRGRGARVPLLGTTRVPLLGTSSAFQGVACPRDTACAKQWHTGFPKFARPRLPNVGVWLVLFTLGGACLGYPLLVWLDPLAIFAAAVNTLGREAWRGAWLAGAALPLVLLAGLLWPGLWCGRICPLGATQDLLAVPARALGRGRRGPVPVIGAKLAWVPLLACPAVRKARLGKSRSPGGWPILRRTVLGMGFGGLAAAGLVRVAGAARPRPLRPPGAAGEDALSGLCVRCGNCARVCPSRIIHPDLGRLGAESFLTPSIRFDDSYCLETCVRCTRVCPSGALRPLSPQQKGSAAIGLPRVDMSLCLLGEDRECAICRTHCPYNAIRIVFSEADYLCVPRVDPRRCNGCGACQVMCPTRPAKAIVVYPT
jgi:ferredoxin-type protein NapF